MSLVIIWLVLKMQLNYFLTHMQNLKVDTPENNTGLRKIIVTFDGINNLLFFRSRGHLLVRKSGNKIDNF